MSFKYSDHDNIITINLAIVPKKDDSIFDLTNEYREFRKMYKDYLNQFYNVSIEEVVYKKAFIKLIEEIKNQDNSYIRLDRLQDILDDIFYSNTLYVNIAFDYEDTLYVSLETFLETFHTKYKNYNFIDFIVFKTRIKVLGAKIRNILPTKPRSNSERRR